MSARRLLIIASIAVAVLAAPFVAARLLRHPSNQRQWHASQAVLPRALVRGDLVEIQNIRDFVYRSETDFDAHYIDRTYDLRKLDSVWYAVSRFGGIPGLAHSFLTFGFGDEYVAISVEARKEAGEAYSPLRGLLREYELMYVVGTERDIIGIRTGIWREDVRLYPVRATPEAMRRTFVDMAQRAEKLAREPEFYNTLTSSCASNIVAHVNAIVPGQIRAGIRTVLPAFSDRVAWEQGLIDSDLPFEQVREAFRVAPESGGPDFSRQIRSRFPTR